MICLLSKLTILTLWIVLVRLGVLKNVTRFAGVSLLVSITSYDLLSINNSNLPPSLILFPIIKSYYLWYLMKDYY